MQNFDLFKSLIIKNILLPLTSWSKPIFISKLNLHWGLFFTWIQKTQNILSICPTVMTLNYPQSRLWHFYDHFMSFWSLTDSVSVYSHYIGNRFLTEWFFWAICFNELVNLFNCCHSHETNILLLYFHLFICYYEVVKSAADSSEL